MEVMTLHKFFDEDVNKVRLDGHEDNREIVLSDLNEGSLVINKKDVIALAKEFGLLVLEKESLL